MIRVTTCLSMERQPGNVQCESQHISGNKRHHGDEFKQIFVFLGHELTCKHTCPVLRTQWLISLFLVLRAHWFSGSGKKKKKKTILSLPFLPNVESVEAAYVYWNSRPLLNFSSRREEDANKYDLSLSLSSSSYLFKSTTIPKIDNADCKNQQKKCLLMRITMMRSWTACVGIRVGMFILRTLFFCFRTRA